MKNLLCLLFSVVPFVNIFSQTELVFEEIPGLSQNTVFSIMQDKVGFIWVATGDGLNRFDGKNMWHLKTSDYLKNQTTGEKVIRGRVIENGNDGIWFNTDFSLYNWDTRLQKLTSKRILTKDELKLNIAAESITTSGDTLWCMNSNFGMIAFHPASGHSVFYGLKGKDGEPKTFSQESLWMEGDNLYVSHESGIDCFSIKTRTWRAITSLGKLSKICMVQDTLFYTSENEIHYINLRTGQDGELDLHSPDGRQPETIRCLYEDATKNIWAGDNKGNIYLKKRDAASFQRVGNINQNEFNETRYPVYCLFVSREGILFAGGDVVGLRKADLRRVPFHVYPASNLFSRQKDLFITSVTGNNRGDVFFGTYRDEFYIKPAGERKFKSWDYPFKLENPKNKEISMALKDDALNIWYCFGNEIFFQEKGQGGFQKIILEYPNKNPSVVMIIYTIIQDNNGWLVGTNLGLYKLERNLGRFSHQFIYRLGSPNVRGLWLQSPERLWIGWHGGGIIVVNPQDNYSKKALIFEEAGFKSMTLHHSHDLMWISTMSGLIAYHLPTGSSRNFTEKEGLLNSYIYGVLVKDSQVWLSNNSGISRGIITFKKGEVLPDIRFSNFTRNDGLPDNEMNSGAFYKGGNGLFYFGSIKGITWFLPEEVQTDNRIPKVVLTGLSSQNKPVSDSLSPEFITKVQLPYSSNSINFVFNAIEFANPQNLEFAYHLQGWDHEWIQTRSVNEARYANLSPGTYLFEVKVKKGNADWSGVKQVSVHIKKPFWLTYWFFAILGAGFVAGLYFVFSMATDKKLKAAILELEKQKTLELERLRISREMHDDIGAGLTQITLISESGKIKDGNKNAGPWNEIAETSRQLISNMSEIIWSLQPESKTLEQLMAHLREQLHKLLEFSGKEYLISLPDQAGDLKLTYEQRRNIMLFMKETVNNVIKHSLAKNIEIIVLLEGKMLKGCVKDDGVGFEMDKVTRGQGIANIKTRILSLGGSVEFYSSQEEGTIISFQIPII